MLAEFCAAVLCFVVVTFGLAWPIAARLFLDPAEKILVSAALSLVGVFLFAWTTYVFALPTGLVWILPVLALSGMLVRRSSLVNAVSDPKVRSLLFSQIVVTAWCLGWLALVTSYSGGGWTADWFEHWERARFFVEQRTPDFRFLGHYSFTARPPLANFVNGAFLRLGPGSFWHYQVISTLFGSLVFLPAALCARSLGAGKREVAIVGVLLMVNPLFVQNATFAWTKLPAAFFVLSAIYFFRRSLDSDGPRAAPILCAISLAAAVLCHYSAIPYAMIVAFAWMICVRSRRIRIRDSWQAMILGVGLLVTWFGWAFATYGVSGTFLANSSVAGASDSVAAQLIRIGLNLRDTIVPHFARDIPGTLIAQTSHLGAWRDWWFQLYQLNLLFAFGSVGWLVILILLWRERRETPARKVAAITSAVIATILLGVAVHGSRDTWGLTHICLQPLVLLGIVYLGSRWQKLDRSGRSVVVAGAALDFSLGIALHFKLQSHTLSYWFAPKLSLEAWANTYNSGAVMNLAGKVVNRVEFFEDVWPINPLLNLAFLTVLLGAAVYGAGRRQPT
ncbi:MAG: glycosyltransferase family 39 protein [Opitutaceae bacterium]